MKNFKNYVCVFFGVAAFLVFSGCGVGGGGASDPYYDIPDYIVGIKIKHSNSATNWHGTQVEEKTIGAADLYMLLCNEELFLPPHNFLLGNFSGGYPLTPDFYQGSVGFMEATPFTQIVDPNGQYYLGEVEVEIIRPWRTYNFEIETADKKILLDSLSDYSPVFPGKWYDVIFSFINDPNSSSTVDFLVKVVGKDATVILED